MKIPDSFYFALFVCIMCWYVFAQIRQMREDARLRAALGLRRTLASWMYSWAGFYQWTGVIAGARLTIDRFYGEWAIGWIWQISITLPSRHPATAKLYAQKHALWNNPYATFWPRFNRPLSTVFGRLRRCPSPPKWGDSWDVYTVPSPQADAVLNAAGELDPNEWDIIELENGALRFERLSQIDPVSEHDFLNAIGAARRFDSSLATQLALPGPEH